MMEPIPAHSPFTGVVAGLGWGGWEEPNTKQGCSGSGMSGGREPRIKDINKLQVSRDLPAAL